MADEIRNGSSKVRTHASGATRSCGTTPMSADAPRDVLEVRFPTRRILAIIGDRWTTVVLYCLSIREHRRFNELQKQIPDISKKMLIQTLRNLERDGLLERTVYQQVPPKTEYRLTDNGHKLRQPNAWLCKWSAAGLARKPA